MYIAQTPHIDPLMFHLALQQNEETDAVCGAEKTAFAWYVHSVYTINFVKARCIAIAVLGHPLIANNIRTVREAHQHVQQVEGLVY